MHLAQCFLAVLLGVAASQLTAALSDEFPLNLPSQGSTRLRIITPSLLELTLVTTKRSVASPVEQWNFINSRGEAALPEPVDFSVTASGKAISVSKVGFKRRVLYAPLKRRDLRFGNYLYLELSEPVP